MGLRFLGRRIPCTIGRTGTSTRKREGDSATPVGAHQIVGMFYRPDRMVCPADWAKPIGPWDLWSDDATDSAYNNHVKSPYACSHENLRRADPLYDLVVVTDWNWPNAVAGKGSAIFIHAWRRPGAPTEGCIAMSARNLKWVAAAISIQTKLIVPSL